MRVDTVVLGVRVKLVDFAAMTRTVHSGSRRGWIVLLIVDPTKLWAGVFWIQDCATLT